MKGFWALQLSISNKQERESEQIINFLLSEETANFKEEAKDALDNPISNCSIPYTYFKAFIMKYILKRWQVS
jgi:hypothetical protein